MKKVASVATSDYYRLESGLVYSCITESSRKITITDVIEAVEALREVKGDGGKLLLISDLSMMKGIEPEARKYTAQDAGYDELIQANAIVVKNAFARLIGNFLISINKGNFPMRLFTKDSEAKKWLKKFQTGTATY